MDSLTNLIIVFVCSSIFTIVWDLLKHRVKDPNIKVVDAQLKKIDTKDTTLPKINLKLVFQNVSGIRGYLTIYSMKITVLNHNSTIVESEQFESSEMSWSISTNDLISQNIVFLVHQNIFSDATIGGAKSITLAIKGKVSTKDGNLVDYEKDDIHLDYRGNLNPIFGDEH